MQGAVDKGPFHIHRHVEVGFQCARGVGQCRQLMFIQAETVLTFGSKRYLLNATICETADRTLGTKPLLNGLARLLLENKGIGLRSPGYDRFPKAVIRIDDKLVHTLRNRMEGEQNACGRCRHQFLHQDRHFHTGVSLLIPGLIFAIGPRGIRCG